MPMKKSVFVTGAAGSGKSTVCRELLALGYVAIDIEDDRYGLFSFVRKDTGEPFMDYDNTDMAKVKNASWVCKTDKLRELMQAQSAELVFYCGIASNNLELMPLFNASILLQATPGILNGRLLVREGTDDFANTAAGRQELLRWKGGFEDKMIANGMIAVNADPDVRAVAEAILASV